MVGTMSLNCGKHKQFLHRCMSLLPDAYAELDTTRLTLLFFCLSGLDILDDLGKIDDVRKQSIIQWIYRLQLSTKDGAHPSRCGFRGGFTTVANDSACSVSSYDYSHLAMTYSALCCLLILGDDFSRVDKLGILASVRACQQNNGSFGAHCGESESDARFVFCAAAVCRLLGDRRPFDVPAARRYIDQSVNYDGGIGQGPSCESHGGSTYCATAALALMGAEAGARGGLLRWCVMRQSRGFHGRANKPDDSCYTFWIPATLQMLDALWLVDAKAARKFTLSTQDDLVGGFAKYADAPPDALHTYLSLAGLALLGEPGLQPLNATLNLTERTVARLKTLHDSWPSIGAELNAKSSCCAES